MFTHDPLQAYQNLYQNPYQSMGAFGGGATLGATAYGLPYPGIHPLALALQQQPFAYQGIGGSGLHPQQFQGYPQQAFQQQQNPWQQYAGLNPLALALQNPLQHSIGHAGLQNPLLNPLLAYQTWQQQQQTPFGYPLAPQSFIGGGIGQPYGQINPLAQLALRQAGMGW